jgi:hypothetical protein
MNERIRQLARQADLYAFVSDESIDPDIEKFAELIVRECIEVVERQKCKMSYGPTFVIEDIKQHFGVEE